MMFFLMECRHHPGQDAARERLRPAHRDWVRSGGGGVVVVLVGSALWDEKGCAIGHFGLLQADDAAAALAFAEGDPFARGAVVSDIRLTRLADGFQAQRIAEPMTVRAAL